MAATLKDVAARAGVSIKTVSNVVNDQPYVTPETRARVQEAITLLAYRPNLPARHLRKGRVGILALAIPDLVNTYFAEIGDAVIAAAAGRSYTVLIDHTLGSRANESSVANGLRPHLIDGVVLNALALEMDDLQPQRVASPIVLLGERLFGAPWDHVVIDNVAAARTATEHLLGLGRRRVAIIGAREHEEEGTAGLRLRGYRQALTEAGVPFDARLVAPVAMAYRSFDGAVAMRALLALPDRPDAVFCFNDLMALGALRALRDAGLRVPEDVAVVGFDNVEESAYAVPSLTTIAPDKAEIGRLAVALLLDRIDGTRTGPPERFTPPFRLVVRESTSGGIRASHSPGP